MKTPMQEVIEAFKEIQQDQDPFSVHEAIELVESMLETEKEVMCKFADNYVEDECYASVTGSVGCDISTEEYFDKTFKIKKR